VVILRKAIFPRRTYAIAEAIDAVDNYIDPFDKLRAGSSAREQRAGLRMTRLGLRVWSSAISLMPAGRRIFRATSTLQLFADFDFAVPGTPDSE
jgi:hypothetical protein